MSTNKTTNMEKYIYILEKYLLRFPVMLIVYLLGYFGVSKIMPGGYELSLLFYGCYIFFYFGLLIFIELLGRKQFIIPCFILFSIVLILFSRDKVLIYNLLTALAFVILSLVLIQDRFIKPGFAVFMAANLILWIANGTDSRVVILCLFVGSIYIIGKFLKRDVDYGFIVIMSFVIICFLPIKEEPMQWELARSVFYHVAVFVDNVANEIGYRANGVFDFGNSYVGYSDVGTLTGGLSSSAREEILFRKNGKSRSKKLYLKGAYYKTLTKDGLVDKEGFDSSYNSWLVEYLNTLMNVGIDEDTAYCFSKVESAEVEYRYLRTEDIICPANILRIDDELRDGLDHKVGKGFIYKVQYLSIDYASPYYLEMMEAASDISADDYVYYSYDEAKNYMREIYSVNLSVIMSEDRYNTVKEDLKYGAGSKVSDQASSDQEYSYSDEISACLDTSMSTDRIKELVAELTADADSDYEKAKLIEEYLRQYNYDKKTDLREKDNYIDSFLFEGKTGYCVHYASAMVLMLRDAGIPARYVSGYMYNTEKEAVMSNEAHAWVEAYIRGVGWMTFEPTPINPNAAELAWGIQRREKLDEKDREEAQKKFDEELARLQEEAKRKAENQMSAGSEEEAGDANKKGQNVDTKLVRKILVYVAAILGSVLGVLLILYIFRLIWFRLLTPEKKLLEMIRKECRKIERNIERQAKNLAKNLAKNKSKSSLKNKHYAAGNTGDSYEVIRKLRSNSASLYDYLEYALNDTDRDRLKKMIDMYYISRFRGDTLTNSEVESLVK